MPDPLSPLDKAAHEAKARLLQKETADAQRLTDAYRVVWETIRGQLDPLLTLIDQARANGTDVSPTWLLRQDFLKSLLDQARQQIERWGALAAGTITNGQQTAVEAAKNDALRLTLAALPAEHHIGLQTSWNTLPVDVVNRLIGNMGDGTPLAHRLAQLAPDGVQQIRDAMVSGVAIGKGTREIAADAQKAAAVPLDRALVISRTEVLRAYRDVAVQTYEANDDVIEGWIWQATLTSRSCVLCIAMSGSLHPLSEQFASHPCCRCVPVPRTKSLAEITGDPSIPDNRPPIVTGEEWMKKQPLKVQEAILGKAGAKAWRAGDVALSDFVGTHEDERWGTVRYARSLKQAQLQHEQIRPAPVLELDPGLAMSMFNANREDSLNRISEYLTNVRSEKPMAVRRAGMTNHEALYHWKWDTLTWYFDSSEPGSPAVETIYNIAQHGDLPDRLVAATDSLVFSRQKNRDDSYWEQEYGMPGFTTLATGGQRQMVAYEGSSISVYYFSHELAHNLAESLYGSAAPSAQSAFAQAIATGEEPPTYYAGRHAREDFAESVALYITDPAQLQQKCPQRYNVIKRIMTDASFGG